MSISARIVMCLGSIIVLIFILLKIRKKRIHIHYAIYWTFFSMCICTLCIFPRIITLIAKVFGVQIPLHIFLMGIICLLVLKLFGDTVKISELERKVETLVQEIAISKFGQEKRE